MLLIIVGDYSKWLEVKVTNSSITDATIQMYGVPTTIILDNGAQSTAAEFKIFLQRVTFHKFSAPYYPATNGQAERYVQNSDRRSESNVYNEEFPTNVFE